MLKKKYVFLNALIALLAFIIQFNGFCTIKSINATPMLPLGFLIILSMFLSELSSFFLGLSLGILIDSVSTTGFGFNAIVFSLIGVCVSLLAHYLFNNNYLSSLVLTASITFLYFITRFLIFFPSVNIKDTLTYFVSSAIPSAILTAAISVLFYLLQKRAFGKA